MKHRNPDKADISRDVRVAERPPKRPEEIQFEKDLAYLKEISVPLAERQRKASWDVQELAAVERRDRMAQEFYTPHRGPAKRRTPILDNIQAFFFVWTVVGIICMVGVIIYYTHPQSLFKAAMEERVVTQTHYQRESCERRSAMNDSLKHYVYVYLARIKQAKTPQDRRDAETYKVLARARAIASKIPTVDCSRYGE